MEAVVLEEFGVGLEVDVRAVFLLAVRFGIADECAAFEYGFVHTSVAVAACDEAAAEGVDGFQTYAVHTYGSGEYGGVVLTARVEFRHGVYQFAQGDAASVVAHFGGAVVGDIHLNTLAETFVELVDRVVDGFLEQDVYTIFGVRAITEAADVHTGAAADMLHALKGADILFGIIGCASIVEREFGIFFVGKHEGS